MIYGVYTLSFSGDPLRKQALATKADAFTGRLIRFLRLGAGADTVSGFEQ